MHIGTILVVLGLSLFLVAYISLPFQSEGEDLEKVIESRVAEIRNSDRGEERRTRYCTQCGHRLGEEDRFCAQCGHPVEAAK